MRVVSGAHLGKISAPSQPATPLSDLLSLMDDGNPRILITRLSHIGDCVLTLPILCAIRKQHPQAFIAWAVEKPSGQLLDLHPDLDEIIDVPKGWMGKPAVWRSLRSTLRSFNFDIAIDPQGISKSAMLGYLSGAKQRVGLKGKWGRELSRWLNNRLVETKSPHIVDRSLELLTEIGIENPDVEFRLPVDVESSPWINSFLTAQQITRPFAVINPGASWKSKRWNTTSFAKVAEYLKDKHSISSVITWAGTEELNMAQAVCAQASAAAFVAPQTSLRQYAALCDYAGLFVGCDTGPMHIASAMGTPCIGLFGTTLPEDSGAYGGHHISVQKWYQKGTSRERRKAQNLAMNDIQPEDVFVAVDQMMINLQDKKTAPAAPRSASV